ncbi:hypothetical protein EDI_233950 [Entamoeba dispar SAW760]|uniref:Uncharacterized protein n=1 Tax=Entamoeba dispar (strain ATCC PRA-260 / SAW760) TaxID=370354 RepID=B0E6C5_ENTDS|nr:uncharacterized protein EDI_233950 [Entamoeba dispar SAW760]EDR29933.1 hypothetical protein EDI_233950 [Entamoeba dispar SAW760]|eukprot:EDR29933.1 hypothetical protein EDI_233950 [Entamoeba dispar SAW760]
MLQFIQKRQSFQHFHIPHILSIYSLRQLDTSEFLKDGGVLLGFDLTATQLIGYNCLPLPSPINPSLINYHFNIIISSFFPPHPLHFFSLPILPSIIHTPSLPIQIITSLNRYLIYHFSSNTLHLTILTPNAQSIPCHFVVHSISQPFSFLQSKNTITLITSTHILTIFLKGISLKYDQQINGNHNILSIDLNLLKTIINVNGLQFNNQSIHKITHTTSLPKHIILPFFTTKISYQTISLEGNSIKEYILLQQSNNIQSFSETKYKTYQEAKKECKLKIIKHYQNEKLIHPKRYECVLSNASTFSENTISYLKHKNGTILTF